MVKDLTEVVVAPDTYQVSPEPVLLIADLQGALALCLHDEARGVVWVAGEAGTDVPGGDGWATTVASVAITAAGTTPPPVLGAKPPAVRAVHTTGKAGKAVRLVFRSLDEGAAVRTVVTVQSNGVGELESAAADLRELLKRFAGARTSVTIADRLRPLARLA